MARWQQLSTCNINLVQEIYGRSNAITILIRHNLAEYIECRPWHRYNVEDPTLAMEVQQEFQSFMGQLNSKIEECRQSADMEKRMDTCNRLQDQYNRIHAYYSTRPHEFIVNMQRIMEEESKILMSGEAVDTKPLIDNGGGSLMNDLQSPLFSLSFRHVKDFKNKIDKLMNSLDEKMDLRRMGQEELRRTEATYNSLVATNPDAVDLNNFNRARERCSQTIQFNQSQIREILSNLLKHFTEILQQLKVAHDSILKEIDDWKDEQRRCMISNKRQTPLDYIERDACMLADALTSCTGFYARLRDHLDGLAEHRQHMANFHSKIILLKRALMLRCFIIEKQPPQVMKRDTRFSAAVRIIAGERWGFAIKQPLLKVCLVNADQAQRILYVLNNNILEQPQVQMCGEVMNGEKVMEYSTQTKTVHFQFKNLVLKKLSRAQDRKSAELVTEEKFGVYFQCEVTLPYKDSYPSSHPDSQITLPAVSLPVTVTVHGSQSTAAEATIFWDNSFAPRNRDSFAHPGAHPWGELKHKISDCFMRNTNRFLNEEALIYLGMKVLNTDSSEDLDNKLVSWQAFAKDTLKNPENPLKNRTFTFWEWLYNCIDLTKKHFLPLWKDNLIEGFISKAQTETWLKSPKIDVHTFLVRFPDSTLGKISISYKQPDNTIKHIIYTVNDLKKHKLAHRILDPPDLRYLYPNHPKEDKFRKYYESEKEEVPGYEKDLIKAHIPLDQYDPPTPLQHSSHNDFSEEFLMETIDYDIQYNSGANNQYLNSTRQ